jgi:hypothetical protein
MEQSRWKRQAPLHRFVAAIYKIGILRCVSVPPEIVAQFPGGRAVPVAATVAGRTKRTTLIPASDGTFRLYLDTAMRKAAGVDAGEPVAVALCLDHASRELPVPGDFNRALARVAPAKREFAAATPAMRREVLRYIEHAKAPETRARHIAQCVRVLAGRWKKRKTRIARQAAAHSARGRP